MTQTRHPSVDRLLAAIRKSGEFPAMAKTVGLISSLTSSEATSSGALADTILQDYGLTQKVLRLVNTVAYAQYDEITSLLIDEYTLDDVLKVTLETIYRALGVGKTRVFFLLKDPSTSVAWFRFGFGQSAGEMKPWFEIPIRGAEDLFSLSFTHQKSGEKAGRASGRR